MKSKGILFREDMILAIAAGRKDVTRRPVKGDALEWLEQGFAPEFVADPENRFSPYGYAGDEVWTKETWAKVPRTSYHHDPSIPHRVSPCGEYWAIYKAGWERSPPGKWTPSILQFRWASRFAMPLVSVTIERVEQVSPGEANRESVADVAAFMAIWREMYGGDYPKWVWRLEFEKPK
jgi:hypothetical protein